MADHPITRNEAFALASLVLAMVGLMSALNIWLLSSVWEMKDVALTIQNDVANVKDRMETFTQLVGRMENAVVDLQAAEGIQAAESLEEQLKAIAASLSELFDLVEKQADR